MIPIRLIGLRYEKSRDGPSEVFKDVEWPTVPQMGHVLWFNDNGPFDVDTVWHNFDKNPTLEVYFITSGDELTYLVEEEGFKFGKA